MKTGIRKKMEAMPFMASPTTTIPRSHLTWYPDTEGNAAPVDPLVALEKSTDAQNHLIKVQLPRLESLQSVSEHYNSDPYALSVKVRKRFREGKKVEEQKKAVDDQIKGRYGLPETLDLVEDDDGAVAEAKEEWANGRQQLRLRESNKRRKLAVEITSIPASTASSSLQRSRLTVPSTPRQITPNNPITSLRARILENTARHSNPFNRQETRDRDLIFRK
jgi:coiled-coil domain-containing protein 130